MNRELISQLEITDEDIDWVENILGNISFDECRRNIIKNLNTLDVQAFPGTGKTTVLIAKLAILVRKWPYSNKGICVLSHTNVAREEIEERLGETQIGKKMMSYPHFIGTLHSFFDTFISIPWLRSKKIPIKIIDNDIVLSARYGRLSFGTKNYLTQNRLTPTCCQSTAIPIKVIIGKAGETTNSYKNVLNVVKESFRSGEFTFDEMLLVAEYALNNNGISSSIIQNRFPIILLDEAQDTCGEQWNLLNIIFPRTNGVSSRQAFGDANQAIFNSYNKAEETDNFPCEPILTMANRKRFGESIASLAEPLSCAASGMVGESSFFNDLSQKHTIFLFEKDKIENVMVAYSNLLLSSFSDKILEENQCYGCHVIGMVHAASIQDDGKVFPRNIQNYWTSYNPERTSKIRAPKKLVVYFRLGNDACQQNGDMHKKTEWISKGICRYINIICDNKLSHSTSAFNTLCGLLTKQEQADFRRNMLAVASMDISTEIACKQVMAEINCIVKELFHIHMTVIPSEFLSWDSLPNPQTNSEKINTF